MAAAHAARGLLLQWVDFDFAGAQTEFRRAMELAPNDGGLKLRSSLLIRALGQSRQAIALIRESIATDPRSSGAWYWLGWNLAALGKLEEAEQAARKAVALQPGSSFLPTGLAIIQIRRGEAKAALASAQQEPPGIWRDAALAMALQVGDDQATADAALKNLIANGAGSSAYQIAEVHGLRRDADNVFAWLDRAWANRDPGIGRLLTDPFILRYRNDTRFAAFCKKVGLPTTTDAVATTLD